MIDYEHAELEAERLLQSLLGDARAHGWRHRCALRIACLVAVLELLVIAIGVAYAL